MEGSKVKLLVKKATEEVEVNSAHNCLSNPATQSALNWNHIKEGLKPGSHMLNPNSLQDKGNTRVQPKNNGSQYQGINSSTKIWANFNTRDVQKPKFNTKSPYTTFDKSHIKDATKLKVFQQRGLYNMGNTCFMNSVIQALKACSPFDKLLQSLKGRDIPKVGFPTLHAFVELTNAFEENKLVKAICPLMFQPVAESFSPCQTVDGCKKRSQEDAQEFLSFILEQMHNEVLKLEYGGFSGLADDELSLVPTCDEDEWEIVGRKNKSTVTRTQSFVDSEITRIFGGKLQNILQSKGKKPTANVQPFLLLHLDISPRFVQSVEDALTNYVSPEYLEDYKVTSNKGELTSGAKKSVKLDTLPKVLIMHLQRFSFEASGMRKLNKVIWVSHEILLNQDILVSSKTEGRKYTLVASVTHHGRSLSNGHYTADAKYSDESEETWLRFNDEHVTMLDKNEGLQDHAYILFYQQE